MSNDVQRQIASHIELAIGAQAGALRQASPRVITLDHLVVGGQQDGSGPELVLGPAYDGVLLEQEGNVEGADPLGALDKLLGSIKGSMGSRLLLADGYAWTDGAAFQDHSSEAISLLKRTDGACICSFLRGSGDPLSTYKSQLEWKKDVDALATLSNQPNLIVLVATRFDKVNDKDLSLLQPWFDYSLASFLIGENSSYSYFSFQGQSADDYMGRSELTLVLGFPVGGYFPGFGMYERHFQHGLVVVNPGDTAREMPLARTYSNATGEQLTRLRLEAHSGQILLISPP